jgi:hypothetical protein
MKVYLGTKIPYGKYLEITRRKTHQFQGFKLMLADWFKCRLIEELTFEIFVYFQEKILTNDALCLILSPASRA